MLLLVLVHPAAAMRNHDGDPPPDLNDKLHEWAARVGPSAPEVPLDLDTETKELVVYAKELFQPGMVSNPHPPLHQHQMQVACGKRTLFAAHTWVVPPKKCCAAKRSLLIEQCLCNAKAPSHQYQSVANR
jgi:hypothetical protein